MPPLASSSSPRAHYLPHCHLALTSHRGRAWVPPNAINILGAAGPCCCFFPDVTLVVRRRPRYLCVSRSSPVCRAVGPTIIVSSSAPPPAVPSPWPRRFPCASVVWLSNAAVIVVSPTCHRCCRIARLLLVSAHRRIAAVAPPIATVVVDSPAAAPACLLCCALDGRAHFGPSACHCCTDPSISPSPATPAYMSSSHPDRQPFGT
ncbi:hypothetical protein E2562_013593 [Oryza meyeriana var. granulata]|uniref:Uncharacterized protein n=1 Tax=Oryza meyeriana var. granulata TaxID=110450 RepID=A0A6G1C691_9ORYZ|nr:hypothetical protein E2562_013593 [Oryza meyeriana var. granulata]